MTIEQIKKKLQIRAILSHYNLHPDRNGMLKCPFHDDKKASLKVYLETNTVYCFAGSCVTKGKSLDVIDFIMFKEGCSKHEAILKAKAMINPVNGVEKPNFNTYVGSLKRSSRAKAYCSERCLDLEKIEVGYKGNQTGDRWGRDCLIFPLKNAVNEVVSLYGRSVNGGGHYYQNRRSGLYPGYPDTTIKTLILCESIIDTASLNCLKLGLANYGLLSLYGTNGLGSEHMAAIKGCTELEEIIFALDGDAAGKVATMTHFKSLAKALPSVGFSRLVLPENEDVNSLIMNHEDKAGLFGALIGDRESLKAISTKEPASLVVKVVGKVEKEGLNTSNPNDISYVTALAKYYIKGGIRIGIKDLDSLKVTLVVENEQGKRSRNKLDLYEDKQLEKVCSLVGDKLNMRSDLLELDVHMLVTLLEKYREEQLASNKKEEETKIEVPAKLVESCLDFWRKPDLLKRLNEKIGQSGIVGEEKTRLLLYGVAASYKMPNTLHALIQGSSGSGKTRLLRIISQLLPPEDVKCYTRVTESSFYNQPRYFFKHKFVGFEDMDGLKEEAQYAVREFQSSGYLRSSVSIKEADGRITGGERLVEGPIASISCTTKAELYEDNISRCFVVSVDESEEQTQRIIAYQNAKASGKIDEKKEKATRVFMQNCMRLLKSYEVINPYADQIKLPPYAHKIRRLNELFQCFVRQLTLLHQYQRKTDSQGRLITEKADLVMACEILFESIVLKVDELYDELRTFYELVKTYLNKGDKDYFTQREIRHYAKKSKTQVQRYISSLLELEYIHQYGHANQGYRYKVSYWDDNAALRGRIKTYLQQQIDKLK